MLVAMLIQEVSTMCLLHMAAHHRGLPDNLTSHPGTLLYLQSS